MPATEPAHADLIAARVRNPEWRTVEWVASTGSTNRDVMARAAAGEPGPAVLISEHQTAGRGRLGRLWEAPPGASLAISVLLRPSIDPAQWSWLPLIAGLAVRQAIVTGCGAAPGRVQLKWPNDVLLDPDEPGGGKVCGILVERANQPESAASGPGAVVIGMGINTDLGADELPVPTATSLALHGLAVSKDDLVVALLDELSALVSELGTGTLIADRYRGACATLGRLVKVQTPDREVVGVAVDVDEAGRLVVESDGQRRAFAAGDVIHLR